MSRLNGQFCRRARWLNTATSRWLVLALTLVTPATGCRLEGRSRRAERLLAELAPQLRFGEQLSAARRDIPGLDVRHPGDSVNMYTVRDSGPPRPVAVVVWPRPGVGEHASPDAVVQGVELVMSPEVASRLQQRVTELFGAPPDSTCAGPMIAQTDLVLVWTRGRRGGALLTIPERRPDGVVPTSRLFIYTGGWDPSRSISGYAHASCSASS